MKHLLVIGDGMADLPLSALEGRTPLAAARMPNADRLAAEGRLGRACFIPEGMEPGSDLGILSILGYDVSVRAPGRASLEAAGRGITLASGETVLRANFCTLSEGRLLDASAGGVRREEAEALCEALNEGLAEPELRFVPGVGYRALLVSATDLASVRCQSPSRALGQPLESVWPQGAGAERLRAVMERAHALLEAHEVNEVRRDLGESPANFVWLWAPGVPASLKPFPRKAALAAGVDLPKGIARLAGMTVLEVPGATGDAETDLAGKAQAALKALETHDLAVVHVEAPDEASHAGDPQAKVKALERLDAEVIGPLLAAASKAGWRMALVTDHVSGTEARAHLPGAVPVALWGPGFAPVREGLAYDEASAERADLHFEAGHEMMEYFLKPR